MGPKTQKLSGPMGVVVLTRYDTYRYNHRIPGSEALLNTAGTDPNGVLYWQDRKRPSIGTQGPNDV